MAKEGLTSEFAIAYLLDDCDDCPENENGECLTQSHCFEVKQMAIKALRMMNKAENKGEWFAITQPWADTQIFQCTCCGRHIEVPQYEVSTLTIRYPFCHCGADMRGGE